MANTLDSIKEGLDKNFDGYNEEYCLKLCS